MLFKWKLKCSFCGKSATHVAKLVAGRRGYICDVCAAEAHRIMSEDPTAPTPPQSPSTAARNRQLLRRMTSVGTSSRVRHSPA